MISFNFGMNQIIIDNSTANLPGRRYVYIGVAVGVLRDDPLVGDEVAEAVVDIVRLLAVGVGTLDHAVCVVVYVFFYDVAVVLVLLVDALYEVAPVVEGIDVEVLSVLELFYLLI